MAISRSRSKECSSCLENGLNSTPMDGSTAISAIFAARMNCTGAPAIRTKNRALASGVSACAMGKKAIGWKSSRNSQYFVFFTSLKNLKDSR